MSHKLVNSSNYDSETFNESFAIPYPFARMEDAKQVADILNRQPKKPDDIYVKVVPSNYQLKKFEP